ncbi:leukotriene A-4 hydrolase-like [Pollicipes pollicipes]|uniref:leukotriene A-4 hydrolase-like n=1 Tax=Pollicipes pollicipes TaxID=41117 RepID=UPI001884B119|nr:leukotriene A-4 hydrolase-like [Pollicipes pollicipes]XP_037072531.1 leukotriene A-4 hydrolase-like [Pollicipes pollicipes]XP_037072532.1 leukotriene A-4 hydrolase-like [Pollicipes pollicipes]
MPAGKEWPQGDPSSFSCPEKAAVTALNLKLRVDFAAKALVGSAELTVERRQADATHVVLDTRDLDVSAVTDLDAGAPLEWSEGAVHAALGRPLTVQLPAGGGAARLAIQYSTRPACTALAWLEPAQTAGRRHPYVFSQCQAIHCRSMVPLQDTPAVKFPFTAEVTAPAGLTALMSGLREGQEAAGEATTFRFRQPVPVPAYLIALAVGELESRSLGPRSTVWSEPEVVDKAEYEFADTERMLQTAEAICGPYVWGMYDLLVLPPSFPFGGMENPCLTFVTPTLLAGDRSLADVVAHEITHSWTGNLVTNRNWEHFWLNEGFTTFVERKIQGRLFGEPARHMSAQGGWKSLKDTIRTRGAEDPLTCLVPRLEGIDPDDAFSTVPYEKGHTFLWYLEQLVGGRDEFEPFLKAYIAKFKYKTLDSEDFRSFLTEFFAEKAAAGVFAKVDWQAWFSTPGMPPHEPAFDTSMTDACSRLCRSWSAWAEGEPCPMTAADLDAMSSSQIIEFLAQLLEEQLLSVAKLQKMEELYGMNARRNAEIRFRWLRLCLAGRWREQVPAALEMVTSQGRMKFVRPLYRDLYAWEEVRDAAIDTYRRNKPFMMHVSAHAVAKDMKLTD